MNKFEQTTFDTHLASLTPGLRAAVAVSGGRDSTALMHLLAASSHQFEELTVLTVDHGLRAASPDEAMHVADICGQLNIKHITLVWGGSKPDKGIQEAARQARYGLLTDWCRSNDVRDLYLAHTQDDQAETVLMRLVRGSGIDGLAAMSSVSLRNNTRLLRPLLDVSRDQLTAFLEERELSWLDDPSNENEAYARVRMRVLLRSLRAQGLTPDRLTRTADHMRRAQDALEHYVDIFWEENASVNEAGFVSLDRAAMETASSEIAMRGLSRALLIVGGQNYRPRFDRLAPLCRAIVSGEEMPGRTLSGCVVRDVSNGRLLIFREPHAIEKEAVPVDPDRSVQWDCRFDVQLIIEDTNAADASRSTAIQFFVKPLGSEGWSVVRDSVQSSLPMEVRVGLPALWSHNEVMSVPHIGYAHPTLSSLGLVFSARFLDQIARESATSS